jgi:hypothetical protein
VVSTDLLCALPRLLRTRDRRFWRLVVWAFESGDWWSHIDEAKNATELFLLSFLPFFGPFGWLSLGYAVFFKRARAEMPDGLFWRFNLLNGVICWAAFWTVSMVIVAFARPPHAGSPGLVMLSVVVWLFILVGVSAVASASSFWLVFLQNLFRRKVS